MTVDLGVATIIYIASSITIVGGAIKVLFEAKKALAKPIDDIEQKLQHHDKCLDRDRQHLDKIDDLIAELGEAVNLLVAADAVMLDHMKTGNATGEIDKQIKELDKWLVSRKDYKV